MANDDQPDKPLAPGLYLVATPIGNLEDITLRAIRVLRDADRIACEDTRQTQKLLNHFQIKTPTVSYHQHNEAARTEELIARLQAGARIAIVSDAGTPGISDPGAEVAAAAIAAGIPVFPIPGANAALAALIASGLLATNSSRTAGSKGEGSAAFTFHGFLPAKEGQRRTALEALRTFEIGPGFSPDIEHTPINLSSRAERSASALRGVEGPAVGNLHIFYEAPHRILATLADIEAIFGPAQHIVLARELTKMHEEFLRGPVSEIRKTLAQRATIKGEFVLLFALALSGCPIRTRSLRTGGDAAANAPEIEKLSIAQEVRSLMQSEKLSEMDALKRVARARGLSKSAAYREWQRGKAVKW